MLGTVIQTVLALASDSPNPPKKSVAIPAHHHELLVLGDGLVGGHALRQAQLRRSPGQLRLVAAWGGPAHTPAPVQVRLVVDLCGQRNRGGQRESRDGWS